MGEDPAAIRQEIEETRERMGDTVDALGYKADVPARTREQISDKVQGVTDSVTEKVQGVRERITGVSSQVADATPDTGDVQRAGRQAVGVAQENPLGLAIGAAAVGFLAGMLIPSTRVEDERLGPVADELKEQVRHTGQEALEHGRQVAQETLEHGRQVAQETVQAATEHARQAASEVVQTAQESSQQHAEELKDSAQDSARDVADRAQSSSGGSSG